MELTDLDIHFKDLFENTNDLIHFVRLDGIIYLVNSAWLTTLEYSDDEVLGKSIYDYIAPECVDEYKALRQISINERTFQDIKTVFITRSGKHINLEGQVACTLKNGAPVFTRGVFKNNTYQLKTEKRLNASEGRVETFFNSAPNAVVIINEHDIILDWNPKAEEIFGFKTYEVVGNTLADTIIPERYRKAHLRGMQRFLNSGIGPVLNKTLRVEALRKDGTEFFVNLNISSVKVDNSWLFVAFVSDISESKKLEEELLKKEAELLQTKRLEEKKDEFLSIASHELKTPLTTVKAYTQIGLSVAEKNNLPVLAEYLRKADWHIDKLTYLINELLDISKIQAGKLELTFTRTQFNEYLWDIINSLKHITSQKLHFTDCAPCYVKIDKVRLEQVITNIVSNASKYSPGQNTIEIRCMCTNKNVTVSVQDYGIGIAEDKLNKIFGRFYRVEEIATGFSGLGIGLYIAAEIIKRHDGKIWGKSVLGKGSTFSFTLPVMPDDQEAI
jgi:PAS domain S-box-containing protein